MKEIYDTWCLAANIERQRIKRKTIEEAQKSNPRAFVSTYGRSLYLIMPFDYKRQALDYSAEYHKLGQRIKCWLIRQSQVERCALGSDKEAIKAENLYRGTPSYVDDSQANVIQGWPLEAYISKMQLREMVTIR